MSDDVVEPHHGYRLGPPTWDVSAASRLIADPSLPKATAESQLRRFNQRGHIRAVSQRGIGSNAANLYGPTALAATRVLSCLTDLGILDLATASRALYEWDPYQPKGPAKHPVLNAMMFALRGDWWVYQLRLLRHDQTGKREVRAWCYDPETWTPPPEHPSTGLQPRATVQVQLRPLLLPLHHRIADDIRARMPADHIEAN